MEEEVIQNRTRARRDSRRREEEEEEEEDEGVPPALPPPVRPAATGADGRQFYKLVMAGLFIPEDGP